MRPVKSKSDFDQPFGIMHPWRQRRCAHSNPPRACYRGRPKLRRHPQSDRPMQRWPWMRDWCLKFGGACQPPEYAIRSELRASRKLSIRPSDKYRQSIFRVRQSQPDHRETSVHTRMRRLLSKRLIPRSNFDDRARCLTSSDRQVSAVDLGQEAGRGLKPSRVTQAAEI